MRRNHFIALTAILVLLTAFPCRALQSKHDPLTSEEIEQIREATDRPAVRLKLYAGFIDARATRLEVLAKDPPSEQRADSIHDVLEEYTFLSDELQNNLDEYEAYETNKQRPVPDLRKALRDLQASVVLWKAAIQDPPPDKKYDFAREAALDSTNSLTDQTKEMIVGQEAYFAQKKQDNKNQQNKGYVLP